MTDQLNRTTIRCVICGLREVERAQACEGCRGRLAWQPREITRLWEMLLAGDLEDDAWAVFGDTSRRLGKWTYDPVSAALPAGPVVVRSGPPVTGTREPAAPIPLDRVDLTLPSRGGVVSDPYGDQTGHNPLASSLDSWVADWRGLRGLGEGPPASTVPALAAWLGEPVRIEWACDHHPAVDEYAGEMSRLIAVMRAVLGLNDPRPVLCEGVACPRCERRTLYRGDEYVECAGCGRLFTEAEYHGVVGGQAREVRAAA